jgi:hypothetical protein
MCFITFSVVWSIIKKCRQMYADSMYVFLAEVLYVSNTCLSCLLSFFLFRIGTLLSYFSSLHVQLSPRHKTLLIPVFIGSLVLIARRVSMFGQAFVAKARRVTMSSTFLVTTALRVSICWVLCHNYMLCPCPLGLLSTSTARLHFQWAPFRYRKGRSHVKGLPYHHVMPVSMLNPFSPSRVLMFNESFVAMAWRILSWLLPHMLGSCKCTGHLARWLWSSGFGAGWF